MSILRLDRLQGRLILLAAALACVTLFSYISNRATDDVARSIRILVLNERYLGELRDAEIGQRGYLLTSDKNFLEPYMKARVQFGEVDQELRNLLADRPDQKVLLAEMDRLAEKKFEELQSTIDQHDSSKDGTAVDIVKTGLGKSLMDDIRKKNLDLAENEQAIYEERQRSALFWRTIGLSVLVAVSLMVVLMSWLEFGTSSRQRRALTTLNQSLEERVQQRTQELEQQNKRIESLLADVSHRVGNNLATVAALLSLQSRQTESREVKDALGQAAERVHAIAAGQRRLRLNIDNDMVEAKSYLEDLLVEIRQRLNHQPITVNLSVADVHISGRDAVTFVVLINEIVTNSIKHAFNDGQPGTINVSCRYAGGDNETIELQISDNGCGIPAKLAPSGLGTKIIAGLLVTLNARRTVTPLTDNPQRPGTVITITIPRRT